MERDKLRNLGHHRKQWIILNTTGFIFQDMLNFKTTILMWGNGDDTVASEQ
jgi:hypothetical protein